MFRATAVAVVAAVVRGVRIDPVRDTLIADRMVGVEVVGISTSILICIKMFNLVYICGI